MQLKRAFVFLLTCVAFAFSACGAPSFESQVERYKRNIDKLDALAVKFPQLKADVEKKKLDFAADMEAAKLKGGEEGTRALQVLAARMESFEKDITPAAPAAQQPAQPAGGKLGVGAQPAQPAQPATPAQPAGGKLGGAAQPAQPATPAQPAQPAATGGSGFGGTAPAPAPAPAATTPPPAPGGESGFGGK